MTRTYKDPYRERYGSARNPDLKNKKKVVEEPVKQEEPKIDDDDLLVEEAIKNKHYEFADTLLSKHRRPNPTIEVVEDIHQKLTESFEKQKYDIAKKVLEKAKEDGDI